METRQLVQFVAVAELCSFRRAAERLRMAQPPLSQAIQRLEHQLGVRLFNRTSRTVEITEPGKVLLAESLNILASIQSAVINTKETAQGRVGKLRIGFTVPWGYEFVPTALKRFHSLYPAIKLELHETSSSEQVRMLVNREIDVGILRLPARFENKSIEAAILRNDVLSAIVGPGHPLAKTRSISINDLRSERFILPPLRLEPGLEQFSYRMQVVNLCGEAGFSPKVDFEALHMQTIICLVERSMGVSVVPRWTRKHFSSRAHYLALSTRSDLAHLDLAVAWAKGNKSAVVSRFRESLIRNLPKAKLSNECRLRVALGGPR